MSSTSRVSQAVDAASAMNVLMKLSDKTLQVVNNNVTKILSPGTNMR